MFKRQQNESAYGKTVTVTERVFTKLMLDGTLLVNIALGIFMRIQQTILSSMLCDRQTDGRMCSAHNTFVMSIKFNNYVAK
jgi:hypothetical protein